MPPSTRTAQKKTTTAKRTTRAPAPRAQDPNSKYAPTAWASGTGGLEDLEVPSGQLCQIRRPGLEGLIKAGVLQNMDSLTALVNEKHIKRVAGTNQVDLKSLDEKALMGIMDTVDRVVCYTVIQPPIHRTPNDVTNRQPGVIYADMIDVLDKMFIFNYVVGGTRDLETFRGQFEQLLGDVAAQPGVPGEAE